ncbi:MAG: helix-turn-helix transcriptional regulator [Solirubrobacterales bacterium]|nr:helix-turn-helix transcriptional regulator [Solirubrobacterales bacterium]
MEAAIPAFAEHGFRAASTVEIAKVAGISQAYLFRLFPTKADLFVAVCIAARERMLEVFAEAAASRSDDMPALKAMGEAYRELLGSDRNLLLVQLQSQVVSGEPKITAATQRTFHDLHALVAERSGATDEELQAWFAQGMLMNVMAAIGALDLNEPWACSLCEAGSAA